MRKLKIAIVGCGRVSIMHLKSAMMLRELCELVAVCDVKAERADAAAKKYGANKDTVFFYSACSLFSLGKISDIRKIRSSISGSILTVAPGTDSTMFFMFLRPMP